MVYQDKGDLFMDQSTILSDTPENLINKYKAVLTKAGIPVTQMVLFGSYAKGNPKAWSDVDVCVVSPIFGKNGYDEMVRLKLLTSGIDEMIEPHPYHPKDLANPYDPLAFEIRTYGKQIV